jgi:hypothetical protein
MLTPRQHEVCVLVTDADRTVGHITMKAIGVAMGISPRTAEHLMRGAAIRLRLADPSIPDVSPRRVIVWYARNRVRELAEVRAAELLHPPKAA